MQITGVVLCGGQSSRMGTDKGMLTAGARHWAQLAADKLGALSLQVVASVNETQYNLYTNLFSHNQLIQDDPSLEVYGPLRGILSVHLRHPKNDLFVLACDMPLITISLLQQLYNSYSTGTSSAYVYFDDNIYEPLCGIYTAQGLTHIRQLMKDNLLVKHSMKYVLSQLSVESIPIGKDQKKYFINCNEQPDLNNL